MSASFLANSHCKLMRSFQRPSSAGPHLYALGMTFHNGLGALLEGSDTANLVGQMADVAEVINWT